MKIIMLSLILVATGNGFAQVTTSEDQIRETFCDEEIQTTYAAAQMDDRDSDRNEASLNAFNVLGFGVLDGAYERILTSNSSISVDIFSNFLTLSKGEQQNLDDLYTKDFSLTTGYKYFFNEDRTAWGFYSELFGMLSSGSDHVQIAETDPMTGNMTTIEGEQDYYTDLALGVGVGYKYVARQGFMIDLSFGLGRNLFDVDSPNLITLPAINFGYRF